MPKIAVIGGGNVGGQCALAIAQKGLADVVLIDILGDLAKGKALDISQALPGCGVDVSVTGSEDFKELKGSDIVVVTAGVARTQDVKDRKALFDKNKKIITEVCKEIKDYAPESIVIIVTNPLDMMTKIAYDVLGFDKKRVLGMGGQLDSLRFAQKIKKYFKCSYKDISTTVIGMHGKEMIPLPEFSSIKGIPLPELLAPQEIDQIVEETKNGGQEVVEYLKTGSAYFAPGEAISMMVESILGDTNKIVCASVLLEDDYGQDGIFLGVPVMLGKKGLHKIIKLNLSDEAKSSFKKAAKVVKAG
jgi:malate dehydrogenase